MTPVPHGVVTLRLGSPALKACMSQQILRTSALCVEKLLCSNLCLRLLDPLKVTRQTLGVDPINIQTM